MPSWILIVESIDGVPLRERIGVPIAILMLLGFAALGVDMVIRPRRHMNVYMQRGGKMLRDWNELQMQIFGALCVFVSGGILFDLAHSIREWLR